MPARQSSGRTTWKGGGGASCACRSSRTSRRRGCSNGCDGADETAHRHAQPREDARDSRAVCRPALRAVLSCRPAAPAAARRGGSRAQDRKSKRLNSSHLLISYAVFCLKKKKKDFINKRLETFFAGPIPPLYFSDQD